MNIDSDQPFRLFVYGTLMPGEVNHLLIEQHVRSARPATIEGVLVDLGAFPALIAGDGIVEGMLLELASEAIEITDRLEGFHPDRDHCLYVRKEVIARLDDGEEVQAWTYEYANPSTIEDRPRLILDGKSEKSVFAWHGQADLQP